MTLESCGRLRRPLTCRFSPKPLRPRRSLNSGPPPLPGPKRVETGPNSRPPRPNLTERKASFMAEFQKTNPAASTETTRKFVQFIMVQAQNILYVLGRIPTPEGERLPPNLQAAKMMIDHLDLIALKTQGNLNAQEEKILKEALQQVQMAFVEASGGTPPSMMPDRGPQMEMPELEEDLEAEPSVVREAPPGPPAPSTPRAEPGEDKKKFFKSYG
ncbi:MAG: DUF1844 domain-containing protein [Verrucomicrobia bacterium]|nr:DUF1844 domain-containing protein [Verrucomicrobiota bacterium]